MDRGQPQPLPGVGSFCQASKVLGMVNCCLRSVGPPRVVSALPLPFVCPWGLLSRWLGTDRGEVHCSSRPGPRLVEGLVSLSEGSGALHSIVSSLFPGPSSSPTGPMLGELEGFQKKA